MPHPDHGLPRHCTTAECGPLFYKEIWSHWSSCVTYTTLDLSQSYDAIGLQALLLGPTLVCHVHISTMLHQNFEGKHKWKYSFNFYVREKVALTMAFQYKWRISVSPRKRAPKSKNFIKTEKNRKKSLSYN